MGVFQNANEPLLCGTFEAIDEPIMKFLQDVTVSLPPENTSFTITFHFAPNQFFTNKELTKEYLMKNTFDPEDPLDFDGPEIYKSKGCKIDWKAGKNTTVKVIKPKQKKRESFFNFFSPPKVPDNEDDIDDVLQALITEDFDIGFAIKEKLVPRAVLFYTGEALEGESEDEDEDGDEEEDEEDD